MVKFLGEQTIKEIDANGNEIKEIVKLPVKKVRDFGWVSLVNANKFKIFWYAASEGKVVIVSKMKS